ncbi:non-ribosomal peptide synthetase [Cupriavidus consociatus]|uniref:non-ribosomal peptide synthetase n=1 Tax=Cupriavidus consociatus TaxID=2821357 RepID=UPI001AE49A0D|nr:MULTISPECIES: non-ribosomal peptide synthetase [unclassified Cupriavidus]MBP0618992.1 amino acid adenylation domain-containing protein [Cupriavidus sp. LEh25]MDK2655637.1 non-ribosomal peptide synthetase [Cupriavidus sp. LEh21]
MRTLRAEGVRLRLQDGRWRVAGDSAAGTDAQQAAAELLAPRAAEADAWLAAHPGYFDRYPAGPGQLALLAFQRRHPHSAAYNMVFAIEIPAALRFELLEQAVRHVVDCHEALHSGFIEEDGEIVMARPAGFAAEVSLTRADGLDEAGLHAWFEREADEPFDPDAGQVCRFRFMVSRQAGGAERMWMCAGMHHIAGDYLGFELVCDQIFATYDALCAGEAPMASQAGRYRDWLVRQRQLLAGPRGATLRAHWEGVLEDAPAAPALPGTWSAEARHRGAELEFHLTPQQTAGLRELATRLQVSVFVVMLALFKTVVHRASGEDDFLIGTPTAGRSGAQSADLIGFTLNTVPLRANFSANPAFAAVVRDCARQMRGALRHQQYPLARMGGEGPLFRHMTTFVPVGPRNVLGRYLVREYLATQRGAANDMNLRWQDEGDRLRGQWRYDADRFDAHTIQRLVATLRAAVDAVLDNADARVGDLPLYEAALLSDMRAGRIGRHATALAAFEAGVRAHPERLAVDAADAQCSYAALDRAAGALAASLRGGGVQPGEVVGLLLPRGARMAAAMLGAWKAGAAFLCLDAGMPAARLAQLAADAGLAAVVGEGARPQWLAQTMPGAAWHVASLASHDAASAAAWPAAAPAQPAYLIYTSGSTGTPKAVVVTQGNLAHYAAGVLHALALPAGSSLASLSSVTADLGHTAWFGALLGGHTLRVLDDALGENPEALAEALAARPADCLKIVPSHLRALLAVADPARLVPRQCLVFGGEALDAALVARVQALRPACRVVNHYGPTETTVGCLTHAVPDAAAAGAIPVGQPLAGVSAYVLDRHLNRVPRGAVGELFIGGAGVGSGYLRRPALTAERFVPDPFEPGGRLYRTGDRVRMDEAGAIVFLGRADAQVKIRGFRVEPGEVEAWLRQAPGVRDAVVLAQASPAGEGLRLVAYLVSDAGQDLDTLRTAMAAALPAPMLPAVFVPCEGFARLRNGKVDRKALPAVPGETAAPSRAALRDETEATLARLLAGVLGRETVGADDNFFALGGDSILGLQLVAQARKAGLPLTPRLLFAHPTPGALAAALRTNAAPADTQAAAIEQALAALWREILQREQVDRDADFFALGGDSILALQIVARARAQQLVLVPKDLFAHPTLARLAAHLAGREKSASAAATPAAPLPFALSGCDAQALERLRGEAANIEDAYPLSPLQEGLLFHHLRDGGNGTYVNQLVLQVDGPLDTGRMAAAWQALLDEHPILRTTFAAAGEAGGDRALQCVHARATLPVTVEDWRGADADAQAVQLADWCRADRTRGFDPAGLPLMRLALLRTGDAGWWLVWSRHHLIVDGWGSVQLLDEALARYADPAHVPTPRRPYRDYIAWLAAQPARARQAFWRAAFAGLAGPSVLPGIAPPSAHGRSTPLCRDLVLPAGLDASLRTLAAAHRVTLNTVMQAAWGIVLSRHAGSDDIVFGVTSAGRPAGLEGAERMLGVFINTLPLRLRPQGALAVAHYLQATQHAAVAMREFEHAALAEIQAESGIGGALFDTLMVFQNLPDLGDRAREVAGLRLRQHDNIEQTHYGLTLEVMPDSRFIIRFTCDAARVQAHRLAQWMDAYAAVLGSLAAGTARVGAVDMLDGATRARLQAWSASDDTSVALTALQDDYVQRVARQVAAHPQRVLAHCGAEALSYGDWWERAGRVAGGLRAAGVRPDDLVAVLLPRGLDWLIALAGILRAGAAWVPLDVSHPAARWQQVLAQARAAQILTDARGVAALDTAGVAGATTLPALEAGAALAADVPTHPAQLAYVLFTSGSTGVPKGAMVTRTGMLNNMLAKVVPLGLGDGDVIAQTAPPCFDISVWQALAAPVFGARVEIIADDVVRDPAALTALLAQRNVTLFEPVPSLLQAMLDCQDAEGLYASLPALRWVLPTGEALPPATAHAWLGRYPGVPLMNAYGPAECSDDVAFHSLRADALAQAAQAADTVPIGRPTANAVLQVLDADGNLAAPGVVGEIAVAGAGVGRGYLADPRRTAAAFVPDPTGAPGSRRYLSGDLGRWREDGVLEYIGRKDFQVKLRGYRVELGEIEAVLAAHPAVRQALVTVHRAAGTEWLTAYWQPQAGQAQPEHDALEAELSASVASRLPVYMVPSAWVCMPSWPLNANGKLDRKALPAPQVVAQEGAPPATPTEQAVAGIWEALLPGVRIGRDSHFFRLGGHSLVATRVVARLRAAGHAQATLRDVFEAPVLCDFAARLDGATPVAAMPALVPVPRAARMPVSLAQQRLWLVERLQGNAGAAYNMAGALRLRGPLELAALRQALAAVAARHEILRTAYPDDDGEPYARIDAVADIALAVIDLQALVPEAPEARKAALREAMQEHASRPFDLGHAPLWRATLLRCAPQEHVLLVAMHHLVSDGWSVGLLVNEITHGYRHALAPGQVAPLPPLALQYADYAAWQRDWLRGAALERLASYWRGALAGAPAALALPADRARPPVARMEGDAVALRIDGERMWQVHALARAEQVTPFIVLLASFQCWLHRATAMDDLLLGTDVAGRHDAALEPLIGFFVNVLPLRSRRITGASFRDVLAACRRDVLAAFEHDGLPFDRIVEAAGVPRDRSRNPLVQALFVLQNTPAGQFGMPGVEARMLPPIERTSKFDMALFLEPESDQEAAPLRGDWVFANALFESATVARFAAEWLATLEALLRAPDQPADRAAAHVPGAARPSKPKPEESRTMETSQRMAAKLDQLKSLARPRPAAAAPAAPGRQAGAADPASQVRLRPLRAGEAFPVVIEPAVPGLDPVAWAARSRELVAATLHRHAGIVFRGFDLPNPQAFEAFAEAMHPGLYGSYGDLPKKEGGRNTYRSTPYPERQMILYHNESAHLERWPRKQWFFCELPSAVGGATPIVDCRELLRRLPPALAEEFARKQLMYVRTFTPRLDVDWRDFYKTDDRAEVEARCRAAGIDCRWLDGDVLQTRAVCPAIVSHPVTGERSFFNQVQLHHVSCLEADVREDLLEMVGLERMPRHVMFGDGTPIPDEAMALIGELYEACAVRFDWQHGDVVMLDNMLAAHARDPYEGPRKIVVAMGDMFDRKRLDAQPAAVRPQENAGA